MTDQRIRLHRIAPWNRSLSQGSGNRYAQVGERYFHAEGSGGIWSIWEVDKAGLPIGFADAGCDAETVKTVVAAASVGIAFNLPQVAAAIAMRLDGQCEAEIRAAVHAMPSAGTGRNHPKNVDRRRAQR